MQEASSSVYSQQHQFPEQEQLKCPRCESTNTKFCYYNNYNLSQPRHFCKTCRRYWTKGGALRNIPVGGGTRKNAAKRSATKRPAPPPTKPGGGGSENHESGQIGGSGFAGQFGNFLASAVGGQFGNFLYGPALNDGFGDPDPVRSVDPNPDAFLNIGGGGESGGDGEWSGGSNGWPDLAMYTPGSSFQ